MNLSPLELLLATSSIDLLSQFWNSQYRLGKQEKTMKAVRMDKVGTEDHMLMKALSLIEQEPAVVEVVGMDT
jgi:hypothetical protein